MNEWAIVAVFLGFVLLIVGLEAWLAERETQEDS